MKVLLTDYEQPDTELERSILAEAGLELVTAQCRTPEDVIDAGQNIEAFLVQLAPITREVFEVLPQLRLISGCGVGVDKIDIEAAQDHGVWVANVPDANTEEVAVHSLGMALSLIRHLPFYDRSVRAGAWHYEATGPLRRAGALTLGIAGMGRIGQKVAQLAQPCFGQLLGYDPYLPNPAWPAGLRPVKLTELFQQSNIISLHMPLTEETVNLVNADLLGQMPEGSYLVNAGRGALVNIDDLLQSLDRGQLAGAALDVLPQEPPSPDHAIIHHPRALITPHAAFYSIEGEEELRRKHVVNVVDWAKDGRPTHVVIEGKQ